MSAEQEKSGSSLGASGTANFTPRYGVEVPLDYYLSRKPKSEAEIVPYVTDATGKILYEFDQLQNFLHDPRTGMNGGAFADKLATYYEIVSPYLSNEAVRTEVAAFGAHIRPVLESSAYTFPDPLKETFGLLRAAVTSANEPVEPVEG
ncbi:MAG: hypothetical protein HZA95_03170 [Candidatus Vogelbacteria bacterium]|nr:hypothetical protein [Candidatus Vogelbacteria bacterium]